MPPSEVAPAGVAGGDLRTSLGPLSGAPVAAWQLASGLLLLVETDHRLPLVALHLDYPAGSRHEPAARCGLAHLTEHLAAPAAQRGTREGSPTIPELGGWANAATAHDRTSFTQMLPSGQLAAGLRIEADRVGWTFSRLTDEALALEKRVLLQERRERVENRPYGRSLEILQARLFPDGHPYGRPAAGLPEGGRQSVGATSRRSSVRDTAWTAPCWRWWETSRRPRSSARSRRSSEAGRRGASRCGGMPPRCRPP